MKKNIKRYLSYVLGVILAMGLGLSYAYAVGANDSNAFVTTTEWETKVAQIEASLDNVTKTINDTNMDFVMNGPRLQASLVDGYENIGAIMRLSGLSGITHEMNWDSLNNLYPIHNDINLQDNFNGGQVVTTIYWPTSSQSVWMYAVREKMAFKTDVPDIYLIATVCAQGSVFFHYVHVGTYPIYNSTSAIPARTLKITLPRSEWKKYDNTEGTPTAYARETDNVLYGYNIAGNLRYSLYRTGAADGFSNQGAAAVTKSVNDNEIVFTFEFPASSNSLRSVGSRNSFWDIININLLGHRLGNMNDRVLTNLTTTTGFSVSKVYSPMKNYICLKSYQNGEIPIMNE